MIVDDGIVVTENAYRYYEQGESRYRAVINGTNEVMLPVIAAVLTTVAAFLPMMLMSGWLGKYMAFIPKTVIICLLASLVECLFILPSHLFDFPPRYAGKPDTPKHHKRRQGWMRQLVALYLRVLRACVRRRYVVVAVVLCAAVSAVLLVKAGFVDIILFGGRDAPRVEIQFEVQDGTRLEDTLAAAKILEASALAVPRDVAEWVFTHVGTKGWRVNRVNISSAARVDLDLVHHNDRTLTSKQLVQHLRGEAARSPVLRNVIFEEDFDGPTAGDAVELDISGPSFDVLRELTDQVKAYLESLGGVYDIRDNYLGGKDELQIVVDEERAKLAGLDLQTVAYTTRAALHGIEATTFYEEDEDIPVRVRYHTAAREDFTDLSWLEVVNANGERVPFTNIARTVRKPGMARIYRYDGERTITVNASVDEAVTNSLEVNTKLEQEFAPRLAAYPAYRFHYGGEHEETNRSVTSLYRAFLVGIILIYMILGTLFKSFIQPIIVMAAVPFSFIGVVVGFIILDEPLGMMSLVGTVALAGIVVNDSLILVDFINRNRASGMGPRESVLQAGRVRIRAIILTTTTTVFGVMPIALGFFGTDDFLRPMAIAIGWGLSFASLLTLLVIPTFYTIVVDDLQPLLARIAGRIFPGLVAREADEPALPTILSE